MPHAFADFHGLLGNSSCSGSLIVEPLSAAGLANMCSVACKHYCSQMCKGETWASALLELPKQILDVVAMGKPDWQLGGRSFARAWVPG